MRKNEFNLDKMSSPAFKHTFKEENTGIVFTISACSENELMAHAEFADGNYQSDPIEFPFSHSIKGEDFNKPFKITIDFGINDISLIYEIPAINFCRTFILNKEISKPEDELHAKIYKLTRKVEQLEKELEKTKNNYSSLVLVNEYIEFWIDHTGIIMKGNPVLIKTFCTIIDNMQLNQCWEWNIIRGHLKDELRDLKSHKYLYLEETNWVNILFAISDLLRKQFYMLYEVFHNEKIKCWSKSRTNLYEEKLRESNEKSILLMEVLVKYDLNVAIFDAETREEKNKYQKYKETNRVKLGSFKYGLSCEIPNGTREGRIILLNHDKV